MQNLQLIFTIASSKPLLIRAVKIAIVVGIILNTINQGELIFAYAFDQLNYLKMGLTFCVPFCVSMYTAVAMKIKFHVGEKAVTDATIMCKSCKEKKEIKKEEIIPFCDSCKEKTSWKVTAIKG